MTADPEILLTLAVRAEAGGDATLSDDVWRAMGWRQGPNPWEQEQIWQSPPQPGPVGGGWRSLFSGPRPDLCTSIDAQAALPGRVLEVRASFTWADRFEKEQIWQHWVNVWHEDTSIHGYSYKATTEPLARLAALLRALAAKDTADAR